MRVSDVYYFLVESFPELPPPSVDSMRGGILVTYRHEVSAFDRERVARALAGLLPAGVEVTVRALAPEPAGGYNDGGSMGRPYDPTERHRQRERERERERRRREDAAAAAGGYIGRIDDAPKPPPSSPNTFSRMMNDIVNISLGTMPIRVAVPSAPPKPAGPPPVAWDDVVGQADAKAAIREAVEGATKHAALYKRFGRRPVKGVLLYGPPGNGKTMLGKAAAGALSAMHQGKGADTAFTYIKASDLQSKYVGETERLISQMFSGARIHKSRHGYPAVIFIDEADAIMGHRGRDFTAQFTVPTFLAEMDGQTESGAFIILASNRADAIDTAILREGRIDRKILVGRPTREDAIAILSSNLRGRPLVGDSMDLAIHAAGVLYDSAHVLYVIHMTGHETTKSVTLGDFTSGAQLAGLVDAATSFAIARELEAIDRGVDGGGGICCGDFDRAIARTLKEQRDLAHPTELYAFCESFAEQVCHVERVRADGVIRRASVIAPAASAGLAGVALERSKDRMPQC